MKRQLSLLIILVAVLAAVGLAPQVQAAPWASTQFLSPLNPGHYSFKYKGLTADAYFGENLDECSYRDVYVLAGQNISKSGPGKPSSGQGVNVGIYEYNYCTGEMLKAVFGYAPVDGNSFQIDKKLNGAHVVVAVPVTDAVTGASLTLNVDLTWIGVGEVSKNRSQYQYQTKGCRYSSRFSGSYRQATAAGTISDGSVNYANSLAFGDLQSASSGEMTVGCGL
ncbi:MAG: hypothetical protein R2911_04255 [Caldilineaceae bacterium]